MASNRKIEVQVLADASQYTSALKKASTASSGFGSKLGTLAKVATFAIGGAALGGIAATLHAGYKEWISSTQAASQTAAVLKSTGNAANVTAKQVDSLAGSLLKKTGVDDEVIKSGENMLLTFTQIQNRAGENNDIFTQATKTTLDLSQAMGLDMKQAALQVGKALNDPARGMSRLQRIGVAFTDSQKEAVKAMTATGNTAGAQKVILAELNKEFGGSAEAFGKTLPGQINVLKESFNNLAGDIVAGAAPTLARFIDQVTQHMPQIETVMKTVFGAMGTAIMETAATFERNWPRIKQAGLVVMDWYDQNLRPTMQSVLGNLELLFEKLTGNVKAHTDRMGRELDENGNRMETDARGHTTAIEAYYRKMFSNLESFTNAGLALIRGDWSTAWEDLKKGVIGNATALFNLWKAGWVKIIEYAAKIPGLIVAAFGDVGSLLSGIGSSIIGSLWSGMKSAWDKAAGWLGGLGGKIKSLKGPEADDAVLLKDEGHAIMRGFHDALVDEWVNVDKLLSGLSDKIKNRISAAIDAGRRAIDAKRGVFQTAFGRLTSGIFQAFDAETSDHQTPAEKLIAQITDRRQMEDLQKALADAIAGGDPQAILRAQEDIQMVALQKQADAERQNYNSRRDNLRQSLEDRLNMLETHFTKEGGKVGELTKDITTTLKKYGIDFKDVGEDLGAAFVTGLKTSIAKAGKGASQIEKTIANVASSIPSVGKATPMAAGGIVTSPTLAMVGEAGPEAVIPLGQYKRGGGDTYNVTVNGAVGSPSEIANAIRRELLRVSARNGSVGLA